MSREERLLSEARCCACVCCECGRIRSGTHLQAHVSDAQRNKGFLGSKMMIATKKICFSVLVIGMSGGVYAQAGGGATGAGNGTFVQSANGARTTPPSGTAVGDDVRASAGLTKGTDGIISSMRSNGTRTTESSILRAPNRTGTIPARR